MSILIKLSSLSKNDAVTAFIPKVGRSLNGSRYPKLTHPYMKDEFIFNSKNGEMKIKIKDSNVDFVNQVFSSSYPIGSELNTKINPKSLEKLRNHFKESLDFKM